jgi:hypothetical protein
MFSGMFLLQNYKQAFNIQRDVEQELQVYKARTGFGADDFRCWHEEEMHFLSVAKKKESEQLTLKVSYVEALENFYAIGFFHFHFLDLCCLINR